MTRNLINAWKWIYSWKIDFVVELGAICFYDVPILPLIDFKFRFYQDGGQSS